jgi:hypothetical protein
MRLNDIESQRCGESSPIMRDVNREEGGVYKMALTRIVRNIIRG